MKYMKKKLAYLGILSLMSSFLVGYVVAILSFKEEIWVDSASGEIKTAYSIFPYSNERINSSNAFRVFFGRSGDPKDWQLVEERRLFSFRESITKGYLLVRAENDLVYVYRQSVQDDPLRKKLKTEFYHRLREKGLNSALEYGTNLRAEDLNKYNSDAHRPMNGESSSASPQHSDD